MKYKIYLLLFAFAFLLSSCEEEPDPQIEAYSVATYASNTLDYPISIQCFYKPNHINWTEEELIPWSENPISIDTGETKMVINYILPERILIYRSSDGLLINNDYYLNKATIPEEESSTVDDALYWSSSLERTLAQDSAIINAWDSTYVQLLINDSYRLENLPVSSTHLYYIQSGSSVYDAPIGTESIDEIYNNQINGKAVINCFALNPLHAGFVSAAP